MIIEGKSVWISGAGSGIGRALARRFAREGAAGIAVVDIDAGAAEDVAAEVGGIPIEADVAVWTDVESTVRVTESRIGPIDICVLNAGIARGGGPSAPDADWSRSWNVNVMSHVYALRAILPSMLERQAGYVLHTASAAGLLTNIGAAPYSVTKHAVVALAEWVAVTYGSRGIGVSCLCPQFVDTPLIADFERFAGGEELTSASKIPPAEVAEWVISGIAAEEFLILPHPEVADYFRSKADDYDRWIRGMQRLQERIVGGELPPV